MPLNSPATADALIGGLRDILTVTYMPLTHVVGRLDTSTPTWVLYLDSDSALEDHCWVMLDVLNILTFGVEATTSATPGLRLVR